MVEVSSFICITKEAVIRSDLGMEYRRGRCMIVIMLFYFICLHPLNLIRCEAGRLTYQIVVNKCMLGENVLVLIMSFMSYNWYDFRH